MNTSLQGWLCVKYEVCIIWNGAVSNKPYTLWQIGFQSSTEGEHVEKLGQNPHSIHRVYKHSRAVLGITHTTDKFSTLHGTRLLLTLSVVQMEIAKCWNIGSVPHWWTWSSQLTPTQDPRFTASLRHVECWSLVDTLRSIIAEGHHSVSNETVTRLHVTTGPSYNSTSHDALRIKLPDQ